jgi:methionyl-tRNA synthetase
MAKPKYYFSTYVDTASPPSVESIYRAVLGDAIARHKRMCGFEVNYLVGTNRGGSHIESSETPDQALQPSIAQIPESYKELLNRFDVHATHFTCTSSTAHIHATEALLRRTIGRSGRAIYKARYDGRFCSYDKLDVDGRTESATCPRCGRPVDFVSEERYFFRLSAFRDRLLGLCKHHPEFIQPAIRFQQVEAVLEKGLADIPISAPSRSGGVPWPDDPEHAASDLYSELVAYMSGIGFGEKGYGNEEFRRNWPADLHVIGPSTLQSHAIYWPAFLMAADMPPPKHLFAHGVLDSEPGGSGQELLDEAAKERFGSDGVRYGLLRGVHYIDDSRIDPRAVAAHYQTDLASLEDLVQRVLSLARQHCEGRIPNPSVRPKSDQDIEMFVGDLRAEVRVLLDAYNFRGALTNIWRLVALIEARVREVLPRGQSRNPGDTHHLSDLVHDACEGLGWISLLSYPILPRMTAAIWSALGQTTSLEDQLVDETPWSCLFPGTRLGDFSY